MYRTSDGLIHIRVKYYFKTVRGARCEILYHVHYDDRDLTPVVGRIPTCVWCWATPSALDVRDT